MARFYRVLSDEQGVGSLLSPPGHPNHHYALWEFTGPRGRKEIGVFSLEYALLPEADTTETIKAEVRDILDSANLRCSEMWVRNVYGYFRDCYSPDGIDRSVSRSHVRQKGESFSATWHLAYLTIQEYFPDHTPRLDLIQNPGKGYGVYPCTKCTQMVQYKAKYDRFVQLAICPRVVWATQCPHGGDHEVCE